MLSFMFYNTKLRIFRTSGGKSSSRGQKGHQAAEDRPDSRGQAEHPAAEDRRDIKQQGTGGLQAAEDRRNI